MTSLETHLRASEDQADRKKKMLKTNERFYTQQYNILSYYYKYHLGESIILNYTMYGYAVYITLITILVVIL